MTFKKRGLGRGLEALLAEDSAKEEVSRQDKDRIQNDGRAVVSELEDRASVMVALLRDMQRERLALLEEAVALQKAIEEFESLIRMDLLQNQ
ncbi:MAG: hypothetical protein ACXWF8_05615 [Methylobacter sp.]